MKSAVITRQHLLSMYDNVIFSRKLSLWFLAVFSCITLYAVFSGSEYLYPYADAIWATGLLILVSCARADRRIISALSSSVPDVDRDITKAKIPHIMSSIFIALGLLSIFMPGKLFLWGLPVMFMAGEYFLTVELSLLGDVRNRVALVYADRFVLSSGLTDKTDENNSCD